MELITLYATRERKSAYNIQTTLRYNDGRVKCVFSSMLRQPRKGTKTLTINCFRCKINWERV